MSAKQVIIILHPDFTASAEPHRVPVSKRALEEVCWRCPQGWARIQFIGGSPFESDFFMVPARGSVCSGPVTNGVPGQVYKYSIVGKIAGQNRDYVADPEVEVDP